MVSRKTFSSLVISLFLVVCCAVPADGQDSSGSAYLSRVRQLLAEKKIDSAAAVLATGKPAYLRSGKTAGIRLEQLVADNYLANGADSAARELYKRILTQTDSLTGDSLVASVHAALAHVYERAGRFSDAAAEDSVAIAGFSRAGARAALAAVYLHQAQTAIIRKNYKSAERQLLHTCLPAFTALGDKRGRYNCFDLLGTVYLALGRTSEAKWFYIQAQLLAPQVGKESLAKSYIGLANVKMRIGDNHLALPDLREAERLVGGTTAYSTLALLNSSRGDLDKKTGHPSAGHYDMARHYRALAAAEREKNAAAAARFDALIAEHPAELKQANKVSTRAVAPNVRQTVLYTVIFVSIVLGVILFLLSKRKKK